MEPFWGYCSAYRHCKKHICKSIMQQMDFRDAPVCTIVCFSYFFHLGTKWQPGLPLQKKLIKITHIWTSFFVAYILYIQNKPCIQTNSSLKFKCFLPFPSCLLWYTTFFCLYGIFTQRHTIAETSLRESTHCWSFVHNPHSVSLWSYSFLLY